MSTPPAPLPAPDALLTATTRLLRPLVRLLMRSGVTFPMLAELLRKLYVEVAQADLAPSDRARSDSRVSLRTGIHRKEIRRLRLEPAPGPAPAPAAASLSQQIIARWLGAHPWTDAGGRPCPLPRAGTEGSFETLVSSVTTDLRPRAVLDEWLAQGLVRIDAEGLVALEVAAFVPPPGQAAQLHFFSRNLHDHIAAAAANVTGAVPPFLERSVHYDRLPPRVAERLEEMGREGATELLLRINRAALDMLDSEPDHAASGATRRINLGIYLFHADETPPEAPVSSPDDNREANE